MLDINKKSVEIFKANKAVGWWDDMDRCPFQTMQLFSTEVAEATEGARKSLMDDKLQHRKMAEVEIADVMIRAMDFAGRYNIAYSRTSLSFMPYGAETVGALHLGLNKLIIEMADAACIGGFAHARLILENQPHQVKHAYSRLIDGCLLVGELCGFDLEGAIDEKLIYNANRLDHKRENRSGPNGKSF